MNQDNGSILETNKLIAEFMGFKYSEDLEMFDSGTERFFQSGWYHNSWDWLMPVLDKIEMFEYDIWPPIYNPVCKTYKDKINFEVRCGYDLYDISLSHKPWDCMIYHLGYEDIDIVTDIAKGEGDTRIEAVYNAIVKFIEWYNKNKGREKQNVRQNS